MSNRIRSSRFRLMCTAVTNWGSFAPGGTVVMLGLFFGSVSCRLVGGDQGSYLSSCNTQGGSPQWTVIWPQMSIVPSLRDLWLVRDENMKIPSSRTLMDGLPWRKCEMATESYHSFIHHKAGSQVTGLGSTASHASPWHIRHIGLHGIL